MSDTEKESDPNEARHFEPEDPEGDVMEDIENDVTTGHIVGNSAATDDDKPEGPLIDNVVSQVMTPRGNQETEIIG